MQQFRLSIFLRIAVVVLALLSANPSEQPAAMAQTGPVDYDIPNGHFYTQAHPAGRGGEGYAVVNVGGIPFWDAYQALGGWQEVGYPTSRRYILNGRVAQAFGEGVLTWNPTESRAELIEPAHAPAIPVSARVPLPAHRAEGQSHHLPWSGWWWSVSGAGPALDEVGGPLWKYDRYVTNVTGENPGTRLWEATELTPSGLGLLWAGHCNGWAAASILEDEPTEPREIGGVTFTVADQKGLLSDLHFADAAFWAYGGSNDVNPADFHRMLISWIGGQKKAMIVTFQGGNGEIWSYPAYQFELTYGPDAVDPEWSAVEARVWFADNDVRPSFVGLRPWPASEGKLFTYRIKGSPTNPTDGTWEGTSGRFGHPFQIWYPDPKHRNSDRQLIAPGLDEETIRAITGPARPDVITTPTVTASPTPNATPAPRRRAGASPTPTAEPVPEPRD